MRRYKFTAIIWKEDEGYVSKCAELGVASAGDNIEEAFENLKEAVELYLENAEELEIIEDNRGKCLRESFIAPLEVSVA